ncbi:MAG: hypothetical protein LKJ25_00105 [Clostridia bacterium]|nr:hypothetical protein [Clostridia bacterium]
MLLSINEDLNLKLYADSKCYDFADDMYVADSDENSVTLEGTVNQEYWD